MTTDMQKVWKILEDEIRKEKETLEKREGEFTFSEFVQQFNIPTNRARTILSGMIQRGVVTCRRARNRSFYSIKQTSDTKQ